MKLIFQQANIQKETLTIVMINYNTYTWLLLKYNTIKCTAFYVNILGKKDLADKKVWEYIF